MIESWLHYLPLTGLAFARCAGAFLLAPPTGWRHFPVLLRLGVAAVVAVPLSLSLAPLMPASAVPVGDWLLMLVKEVAVGLAIGLGLWLLVWGFFVAGHLGEVTILPTEEEEGGPLARLLYLVAILLFLQLNGHHWLLAFLRDSYSLAPAGLAEVGRLTTTASGWLYWPGRMLLISLSAAAPWVLAIVLASAMTAALDRCLVGAQVAQLGGGVRYLTALVALIVTLPLLGGFLLGQVDAAAADIARVIAALGR